MIWTDKAFAIYMGHAGEERRVYHEDDEPVVTRSFDDTQVLALARHEVVAVDFGRDTTDQGCDGDPKPLAA